MLTIIALLCLWYLIRAKKPAKIMPPANQRLAAINKTGNAIAALKANDPQFIAAVNYFTDEDCAKGFKTIIEHTIGTVDQAVPYVLKSSTFDDFLSNIGLNPVIDEAVQVSSEYNHLLLGGRSFGIPSHNNPLDYDRAVFVVTSNNAIYMNRAAHWYLDWSYTTFKKTPGSAI